MRIQHNIASMNAYRNYGNNVKAVNGNLEKLSSGYKINRAGDDAAGLAISEKMRAQIKGLDAAQKNVKDGISLVKTAEGAMQEIQDMLSRMKYLATQSSNGTYDNEVDRMNLDKEVTALKSEINRIADSANFNGIKLLDGSLSGKSQVQNLAMDTTKAIKGKYNTTGDFADIDVSKFTKDDIGKTLDYTVTWQDKNGNQQTTTVSLTFMGQDGKVVSDMSTAADKNYFVDASGTKYYLKGATDATLEADQIQDGIIAGLKADDEFSSVFDVSEGGDGSTAGVTFEARAEGSAGAQIIGIGLSDTMVTKQVDDKKEGWWHDSGDASKTIKVTTQPMDALQKFDAANVKVGTSADTVEELESKMFEVDGHKFLLTDNTLKTVPDNIKALGDDVTIIEIANTTPDAADAKEIAAEISRVTGLATKTEAADANRGINATDVIFTKDKLSMNGKSLTLQIGDTADKFNQMDVKIGDMHTKAMGTSGGMSIADISIGNQTDAAAAVEVIKDAINYVSSIRGDLGAIQNRLDHTANNLSVMTENIQDAESTIRDTDVADEMMAYTKNNILIQSAQAMLAQANQIPQGVLQLLG